MSQVLHYNYCNWQKNINYYFLKSKMFIIFTIFKYYYAIGLFFPPENYRRNQRKKICVCTAFRSMLPSSKRRQIKNKHRNPLHLLPLFTQFVDNLSPSLATLLNLSKFLGPER